MSPPTPDPLRPPGSSDPTVNLFRDSSSPTASPSDAPPGGPAPPSSDRFGKFVRHQMIGSGAMGEIWKAWDPELNRWVALKFLKGDDDDGIARFTREARTAGRLNHPNIAAVYEVGVTEGRHWIAMQFIAGQTLTTFPRTNRRTLVTLIRDAARALQAAAKENIIHRDIKPENLMVTTRENDPHLYVLDFGLARITEMASDLSVSGMVVGTPAYMAPEQARGERLDSRADIWSLGATLYELLTNRRPFVGITALATMKSVVDTDPAPPRAIDPKIDPDLETIVLKCLEKDPFRRYATSKDLADDLDRWLAGEAILASKISMVDRAVRRIRRNKFAAASGAALFLVFAGSAALLLHQKRSSDDFLGETRTNAARKSAGLARLSTLWMELIEKKRDLRLGRVPPEKARPALAETVSALDGFIAEHPDLAQGPYVRSIGKLYLGRIDEALVDAEKALRAAPDFRTARRLIGMIRIEQAQALLLGMKDTLENRLRRVKDLMVVAAKDLDDAGPPGRETAWTPSSTSEDEVLKTLQDAMHRAFAVDDVPGAIALLEDRARSRKAEEFAVLLGLLTPDPRTRDAWFSKAIEWAPGFAQAWYHRGAEHQGSGNLVPAIQDFDQVIRIDPDNSMAYNNRGAARQANGDSEGAIRDYDTAIRIDPRNSDAFYNRGNARKSANDFDGAIADFTAAIRINPRAALAYNNRGNILKARKELDAAIRDFDEAIRLEPENWILYNNRGAAFKARGNIDEAIRDYSEAIRMQPMNGTVYINRGAAREAKGDVMGAINDVEKALELESPDWPLRPTIESLLKHLKARLAE